jgi:hypothetical protein
MDKANARQVRSEQMDELFTRLWEEHASPEICKSPTLTAVEPVLVDLAREWFRRGYSQGAIEGARFMGEELIRSARGS